MDRRRADDHLSIVAGMRRLDTERLTEAGVPTLANLAVLGLNARSRDRPPPADATARAGPAPTQKRVTGSTSRADPSRPSRYGTWAPRPPEPSPWDLFFDIEADPRATEVGLEYLLGVVEEVDGEAHYLDIWATSQEEEKAAFGASSGSSSIGSTPTPRCTSTITAATSRAPSSA